MYDDSDWPDEPEDVIKKAFGDGGPGHLQLKSEDKARIIQEQAEFYQLIDLKLKSSYCAVLDRLVLYVQKAMIKAIDGPKKAINTSTAQMMWGGIMEKIDIDLLDLYLRDLHDVCLTLYTTYHKTQKAASEKTWAQINEGSAIEDYLKLGKEFKKVFGEHEDLFLTQERFKPFMITGYVPSIRGDEEAGVLIEKYEGLRRLGRSVSRRKPLLEIEHIYWELGDREKSRDIFVNSIQRAHLERRTEDGLVLIMRYADRLEEIEEWGEAIIHLKTALDICLIFGKDSRYANLKHQLIKCEINQNMVGEVEESGPIWYEGLEESLKIIDELFGNQIKRLDVLSTMVLLRVKQGDISVAKKIITDTRETIIDYLSPRGEANFLYGCAKSFLESDYSAGDNEFDSREQYGGYLLDEAKTIQRNNGEKSDLKKSLELQVIHERNPYTSKGIKDEIAQLNSELDMLHIKMHEDEIQDDYIEHLIETDFWEGYRKLNSKHDINRVHNIKANEIYCFEGKDGTFKRHLRHTKSLGEKAYWESVKKTIELAKSNLDRVEKDVELQGRTPPFFMRMKLLQTEAHWCEGTEKIDKIREIIEGWSRLQSNRGVYRWKNNLAKILSKQGLRTNSQEQIQESQDLYEEVCEFYKEKDASNYFYFSCDRIKAEQMHGAVNSTEKWVELLNDPHIPDTNHIRIELYIRVGSSMKHEDNLEGALDIFRKGTELILETGNIDEERYKLYVGALKSEIGILGELGRFPEAEERVATLVAKGWFNKSLELQQRVNILHSKNEWRREIELLEEKFEHNKNNGQWKLASISLWDIAEIYEVRELTDEAISQIWEKIKYDREYGEGADAMKSISISFDKIATYYENQEQWVMAKEARWEIYKIVQGYPRMVYFALNKIRHSHYKTKDWSKARIIKWKMFHLCELQCKDGKSSDWDDPKSDSKYVLEELVTSIQRDYPVKFMWPDYLYLNELWLALNFKNQPKEKELSEKFNQIARNMKTHRPKLFKDEMLEVLIAWYNHSLSYPCLHEHALEAADLIAELRPEKGRYLRVRVKEMMVANTLDEGEGMEPRGAL